MAPRTASRGQGEERRRRRGSPSPYASDHEVESDNISVRVRSSRSSVHSVSSHVSAASSIANSIYSTLSEDWIRPPYYALPRSARYPLSLQRSIRTLPPHIMIGVRRRSELSSDVKTLAEATRLARQMRTRGLRDYDGSMIRPDVGDQLHTVEFSVVYKPIERVGVAKEEQEEQNCKESRDPAPLFMNPCKSALPLTADSMGFVEYGSDDEDADLTGDGSERVDAVDIGEAEKRVVLDVNDTSAMVAKGINPLDPHPDPLAFYNTHFAYFQKHGCFVGDDDRSDPSFPDVKIKDPWNARELYGGEQSLHEEEKDGMRPAYAQLLKGDASIPPSSPPALLREPLSRRKTVLKKAYARVRSFLSSNDPPPAATMIATTLTLPMNRFQVCSRAKIAPEAGSTVAAMDGRGCGVEGDQDWIARLPCGARTLGQFDRDWLDAMPPLSRTE
ncbi:hypothetical protein BGZ68_000647 [Mortierella alpina]|nr:hypothetical protein BGZ68_000647 [Mortierella alpina]